MLKWLFHSRYVFLDWCVCLSLFKINIVVAMKYNSVVCLSVKKI